MDFDTDRQYGKSFYKSVKAGLTTEEVTKWIDQKLQGSYNNATCRKSRKIFRTTDGAFIDIPKMEDPASEIQGDTEFYLGQVSSSGSVPFVAHQATSYQGYWALAKHGHSPQNKQKPSVSEQNRRNKMYDQCEHLPEDEYEACLDDVKNATKINRRRLSGISDANSPMLILSVCAYS